VECLHKLTECNLIFTEVFVELLKAYSQVVLPMVVSTTRLDACNAMARVDEQDWTNEVLELWCLD